jgi:hypothetical protein
MAIEPTARLFVPHRKRISCTYVTGPEGARELRIDYGAKEVTFDDPRLFAFGEQLIATSAFTGELATTWGPGYAWDELEPMLEALIDEGILQRGDDREDPRGGGIVASPLPPASCPAARWWTAAECETITQELAGRAIELGYLEAILPVFRIAHMALDAEGRQVGEANVVPPRLRLDRETEWRVCQYAGSRYRDDKPMNVTALKAMVKHWKPILATLLALRRAVRERLGATGGTEGSWTIGELHMLACVVLGAPAFLLLQAGELPPPLDPVLSSMFRIIDGIRMTTLNMMFSVEHTCRADDLVTATDLYERAEQRALFIDATGVCAGPAHLIRELLATIVDGVTPHEVHSRARPAQVEHLLAHLPAAIDYGLYALQSWALSMSTWIAMSRACEAVLAVLEVAPSEGAAAMLATLRTDWNVLEALQITLAHDRDVHLAGYQDVYERAWRGSRTPIGPASFAVAIAPVREQPIAVFHTLRVSLTATLGASFAEPVAEIIASYLRVEEAIIARICELQTAINTLLDRPHPRRPLTGGDLHAQYAISAHTPWFPYLLNTLGITLEPAERDVLDSHDPRVSGMQSPP